MKCRFGVLDLHTTEGLIHCWLGACACGDCYIHCDSVAMSAKVQWSNYDFFSNMDHAAPSIAKAVISLYTWKSETDEYM